jgi:hypothetical protein
MIIAPRRSKTIIFSDETQPRTVENMGEAFRGA